MPYWVIFSATIIILVALNSKFQYGDVFEENPKIESVSGKNFGTERVILDGKRFENCTFHNTELIFEGTKPYSLIGCKLTNPTFSLAKYSALSTQMLSIIYKDPAFKGLVEQTFENLRSGTIPSAPPAAPRK